MSSFKLLAHALFTLLALLVTRKTFVRHPKWRRTIAGILLTEFAAFLIWILFGSDDRLYLSFNNIWVSLATFIAVDIVLNLCLFLFVRKKWTAYAPWNYLAAAIATIVLGFAGHQNTVDPKLTEYVVQIPGTSGRDSLDILWVTDLHIGRLIGAKEIDRLREMAIKAKPDYLIFGGDMIHREISYAETPEVLEAMTRLVTETVPEGHVFFILGNHEYYADTAEKIEWISRFGTLLRDEVTRIDGGICLVGRDSYHEKEDRKKLRTLLSEVPSGAPTIVLAHEPEERGQKEVYDFPYLALHGHTHAGQHLLFIPFVYIGSPHIYGRYQIGETTHIISSGYGVSASTIRLGTHSEAVLLRVRY